ncbi:MAG: hypothetical protein ACPGXZ_06920 [Saprospiraceae bacterium]
MKLPNDLRYANRIWMLLVLVSPLLAAIPNMSSSNLLEVYQQPFIYKNGGLFIIYWAVIMVLVLGLNNYSYDIIIKKTIIQIISMLILFISFLFFIPKEIENYTVNIYISYFLTTTFGIWYFSFETAFQEKEMEVIDHLIE